MRNLILVLIALFLAIPAARAQQLSQTLQEQLLPQQQAVQQMLGNQPQSNEPKIPFQKIDSAVAGRKAAIQFPEPFFSKMRDAGCFNGINWGDGVTEPDVFRVNTGPCQSTRGHTYKAPGTYNIRAAMYGVDAKAVPQLIWTGGTTVTVQ